MLHEPAPKQDEFDPASDFKAMLGVKLFFLYAVVYVGFVAIGLVSIESYETTIVWGLNLATVYGFGLIIFALALALIYDRKCVNREEAMRGTPDPNAPDAQAAAAGEPEGEGK